MVKFRTKMGPRVYESEQVERYVDDQFYAFTRGEVRSTVCALYYVTLHSKTNHIALDTNLRYRPI